MRTLWQVLCILVLSQTADAQMRDEHAKYSRPSWWLSVDGGKSERFSLSDVASDARWDLLVSAPMRMGLAYGRLEQLIGVAVFRAMIPLRIYGASCFSCNARVQAVQALATYRHTQSLFTTAFTSTMELGAGVTRWSDFAGRRGTALAGIAANYDLTFVAGLGIGRPLGERWELSATYDIAAMTHERQKNVVFGDAPSSKVNLPTLRVGVRLRLERE